VSQALKNRIYKNSQEQNINCLFVLEEARFGGPQIYMLNLLDLLKQSMNVKLVFPEKYSARLIQACEQNEISYDTLKIQTLSLKPVNLFKYIVNFGFDIYKTSVYIGKVKPQSVYIAGGSWQFRSVISALIMRTRVVWHLNDTNMHPIILFIFRILSRYASGITFASEKTMFYYKPLIKDVKKTRVIPSPVSNRFFRQENNAVNKSKFDINVVTVANISPVKGFELLVDVARLCKSNVPVHFFVVGSVFETQSAYYNKITGLIDKLELTNITFLGSSDNVDQVLSNMDIYFCSSVAESSPIAVWEAMAKGLPIISTDVGDVKKYVEAYGAGFIRNDARSIVSILSNLAERRDKLEIMRIASNKCASENFSQQKCAESHIRFLKCIGEAK
jgi:glycosyltransferase involved in cell wall biosynthesis